jgi:hypothetical protein
VMAAPEVIELVPDVVQMPGGFQQQTLAFAKSVKRGQAVEELECEPAYMLYVVRAALHLAHERQNFFARGKGGVRHGLSLCGVSTSILRWQRELNDFDLPQEDIARQIRLFLRRRHLA